jgi:ketosteroid isomerase-like protein
VEGAAIRGSYERFFKAAGVDVEFAIDEVVVAATAGGRAVAYALTRSHGTQTVPASGTARPGSNREIFIFTQENGAWKIARYMFNKPE